MQNLQVELERIHEKNSALEQDFENEINRNNKNKMRSIGTTKTRRRLAKSSTP